MGTVPRRLGGPPPASRLCRQPHSPRSRTDDIADSARKSSSAVRRNTASRVSQRHGTEPTERGPAERCDRCAGAPGTARAGRTRRRRLHTPPEVRRRAHQRRAPADGRAARARSSARRRPPRRTWRRRRRRRPARAPPRRHRRVTIVPGHSGRLSTIRPPAGSVTRSTPSTVRSTDRPRSSTRRATPRAPCRSGTSPTTPPRPPAVHSGERTCSKRSSSGPRWTMIWLTPNRST